MPNVSSNHDKDSKNTSSGHGALGMGGQPIDDPRDLEGGGEGRVDSDQGGKTGPVGGAFGGPAGAEIGGGTGGNQAVGPMGDKDATADVDNALRKSADRGKG
jgi:hypothetical protein